MATSPDRGIQKIIIPKDALPVIADDLSYSVRYRITSKDGTQTSSWSPKYSIFKTPVFSEVSTEKTILNPLGESTAKYSPVITTKSHGTSFDVSWKFSTSNGEVKTPEPLNDLKFDSYVRWGEIVSGSMVWSAWEYITTSTSNSLSVPIMESHRSTMTSIKYAQFMVHLATVNRSATETQHQTRVFLSPQVSTEAVYNSGSL
jgi:hypothetical protein